MATTKKAKANIEFLLVRAEVKGIPEKARTSPRRQLTRWRR